MLKWNILTSLSKKLDTRKLLNNFLINCCNKKLIIFRKFWLMMFALMFLMLFGIGENILLTCPMLNILMKRTFPLKLALFKWMLKLLSFAKKKSMIYFRKNSLGIASLLGLVLLSMFKKMLRLREEPLI